MTTAIIGAAGARRTSSSVLLIKWLAPFGTDLCVAVHDMTGGHPFDSAQGPDHSRRSYGRNINVWRSKPEACSQGGAACPQDALGALGTTRSTFRPATTQSKMKFNCMSPSKSTKRAGILLRRSPAKIVYTEPKNIIVSGSNGERHLPLAVTTRAGARPFRQVKSASIYLRARRTSRPTSC